MKFVAVIGRMPWAIAFGLFVGIVFPTQYAFDLYDRSFPVLTATATVIKATPEDVTLSMMGTKHRTCQYIRLHATGIGPDGIVRDAYLQRIDTPETGGARPVGTFSMGVWRFWPRDGATRIVIYAQYACPGRMVTAEILNMELPKGRT